jgi:ABC-type sugar transport system ATPase subunit
MNNEIMLEVRSLSKVFPGTLALKNVNMNFRHAEIHGVIGKNGAGKSTFVNILSGILSPSWGKIILNGKEFISLSPPTLAKKEGITIVTQNLEIVPDFNLVQSLYLPYYRETKIKILKLKEMKIEAEKIFKQVGFNVDLDRKMSDLTLSEKQIFFILKVFFIDKAEVVILDEVTSSFSRREQEFIYDLLKKQKNMNKSIIFISHRIDEVLDICDRISVIRDGEVVESFERGNVNNELLCSTIVGKTNYNHSFESSTLSEKKNKQDIKNQHGIQIMSIEGFTRKGCFYNINMNLRKGEILGLAGLVGSGRTEILKAIAGIEPPDEGWINLEKRKKIRFFSKSWKAINSGIIYLTENRDEEGIINTMSVLKNLSLSYIIRILKGFLIKTREEKNLAKKMIKDFEILTSSPDEDIQNLSGGNRQKVLCARVASTEADILLLDEPTKGIDIDAKSSLLRVIREKLRMSAGIIITSPGIEDLLTICDRIIILFEGRIVGEYKRKDFNELEIYRATQGLNIR